MRVTVSDGCEKRKPFSPPHENLIQIPTAAPLEFGEVEIGEQKAIETGWLIEATDIQAGPEWITIKHGLFYLTADASLAIRFSRKEDAELLMKCNILAGYCELAATEHCWS